LTLRATYDVDSTDDLDVDLSIFVHIATMRVIKQCALTSGLIVPA
jgi:hypothetical protein